MHPDQHPHSRGFPWPRVLDSETPPTVVESSRFDRVVWSSPWRRFPDVLLQFDLSPATRLRWTLLGHAPLPSQQAIDILELQIRQLVNVDLRAAFSH